MSRRNNFILCDKNCTKRRLVTLTCVLPVIFVECPSEKCSTHNKWRVEGWSSISNETNQDACAVSFRCPMLHRVCVSSFWPRKRKEKQSGVKDARALENKKGKARALNVCRHFYGNQKPGRLFAEFPFFAK